MDLSKITSGIYPPDEVNVVIEVPLGGEPIKYEVDKASGAMFVDRFLYTAMHYPCNYGFIPNTLSDDGDPVDVMVYGSRALVPGAVVAARPLGVLIMEDEAASTKRFWPFPHTGSPSCMTLCAITRICRRRCFTESITFSNNTRPWSLTSGSRSSVGKGWRKPSA